MNQAEALKKHAQFYALELLGSLLVQYPELMGREGQDVYEIDRLRNAIHIVDYLNEMLTTNPTLKEYHKNYDWGK